MALGQCWHAADAIDYRCVTIHRSQDYETAPDSSDQLLDQRISGSQAQYAVCSLRINAVISMGCCMAPVAMRARGVRVSVCQIPPT
jgi:hypothetical protein